MKLKKLSIAIGSLIALHYGVAQAAEVQVYGKLNVSAQQNDYDYRGLTRKDNQSLDSNASRVGVKGDIDIDEDLKGVYKIEYQVYVDDGVSGDNTGSDEFDARNIYAGLKSKKYGQILAGRNDTPLKVSQNEVDRFNDLQIGDINNYLVGENRMNNTIQYSIPMWNGINFAVMGITGEEAGNQTITNDGDNTFGDSLSSAIQWENESMMLAVAYDHDVLNANITRGVGQFKIGKVTLGGLIQTADAVNDDYNNDNIRGSWNDGMGGVTGGLRLATDAGTNTAATSRPYNTAIEHQNGWMISALWDITEKWAVYAQYGQSHSETYDSRAATVLPVVTASLTQSDFDATQTNIGVDYKFNKKVKVFAYTGHEEVDIDNNPNLVDNGDFDTTGIGLEIKF